MTDLIKYIPSDWPMINELYYLLNAIVIILIMILFAKLVRKAIRKHFERTKTKGTFDKTNYQFLSNGVSFFFFVLGIILIFYTIPSLKALGLTLFAGAGILAAIIGFAAQAAFANIISGIFIVLFKPFRLGDIIKLESLNWGTVEDITLRHTVIRSFQNERYVIPNSAVSAETILNASIGDLKTCVFLEMGISYDSDIDLAMRIMREEAEKHHSCIDNRTAEDKLSKIEKVVTRVIGFGDSSVNIRAYVWANNFNDGFEMKTDLYRNVKYRFDAEGVEIPYPYRTIVYKTQKDSNQEHDKKA